MNKSIFGDNYPDSDTYKNLTLVINKNMRFKFSYDVPFVYEQFGTWKMTGDDISVQCEFLYAKSNISQQVLPDFDEVYIVYPVPKDDKAQARVLYFTSK